MLKRTRDTYIVSDLHFMHPAICKYCGRPYKIEGPNSNPANKSEVERMNEDILKAFDKLPDSCDVWNLGDVFFPGTTQQTKFLDNPDNVVKLKEIVKRMKGKDRKLFLVLGNHDIFHYKGQSRLEFYYSLGFDKVYDTPVILEDKYILSHEPVYITPGSNFTNLYGHTHDLDICRPENINENGLSIYFMYDWDNWAMVSRKEGKELNDKSQFLKFPNLGVSPKNYYNVCWDMHHKILSLNSIITNFK